MVRRGLTPDGERWIEQDLVTTGEVLDVHGGERAIGNRELGARVGANAGRAQADVFDGAAAVAKAAVVADADDFIGKDGDSSEKIFQCFLRGEGDGNAADAEAGEHGGQVEAEDAERRQDGNDHDQRRDQRSPSTMSVPVPMRPALMAWMRSRCMVRPVTRSRNQKKPMLMRTQMVRK